MAKFVSGMALISFFLSSYHLMQERDGACVYGVIYSFYAFFFLRWIRPYTFFSQRDGRWLTQVAGGGFFSKVLRVISPVPPQVSRT